MSRRRTGCGVCPMRVLSTAILILLLLLATGTVGYHLICLGARERLDKI